MESIFIPYHQGNLHLKNRIVKSGIYEGRCDENGFPGQSYVDFYEEIAKHGAGGLITGFAYTSKEGRAMQPRQAGIDHPDKIPFYQKMTEAVHRYDCPVFLQVSHAGRQTLKNATGTDLRGASSKRSVYFRQKPVTLSTQEVYERIDQYANSAFYARESGFDGVQLHAAHGYLIHQFLLPGINNRSDEFAIDRRTGIGKAFLEKIIVRTREKCGQDFPLLVKISGAIDLKPGFSEEQFVELIRFLDKMEVSAIEISYGTMDHALNIFRGDVPESLILSHNPILKSRNGLRRWVNRAIMRQFFIRKLRPFAPVYNLEYAALAKKYTGVPLISVGGFRNGKEISDAVTIGKTDIVGLARPFICEPDFVEKLISHRSYESKCVNCNYCSVMCDTENETRCYKQKTN
jgi:2,4-dienoyl-CoA reductase-like NADH-dependent reductase (Old Yellow Enzyme family)